MNNYKSSTSFEINLSISPAEAKRRITELSDDMVAKTDKEAWMSLIQGYRGSSRFLHLLNKNGIFIQRRTQLSSPHYGVKIQIEPTSYGSKLLDSLTLIPKLRAFYAIWFGGMAFALIIVAISLPGEIAAGDKPKVIGAGYCFRLACWWRDIYSPSQLNYFLGKN